ncbi:MAG: hypothetical protein A3F11_03710 [Gammaproteobacteria bacterium RIFCSPHIGHO2_12_FULL_37_14]|nr:MAG: hypothetical protein A3F11_03710 [Gammaproteobacteria bacterium RIFCSPHIGHO2_12_FULL_37_14]
MQSVKLLIVDDEVVDRAYYQRMLRQSANLPYQATEAINGKEAIDYLQNHEVDCILLDYQLPDMNGLDLLKKIKEISGKFVPVIMLTGRGDEQVAVSAIKNGAEDYFIKNKIEPNQLMKAILNAIRSSQLKKTINQQKKQLKYYAYYDSLTGLLNRHSFEEISEYALSEAKRLNHELAILLIDLDNFMSINDTLGYLAGNEMLIETGKRIQSVLPKEVIISRLGDDEFAVLLTGLDIDVYAAKIAHKIIDEINQPYQLSIDQARVSATIGIAYYPGSGKNLSELLKNANIALARAKQAMRGAFQFYSDELNKIGETDIELEKSLQDAMKIEQEFFLVYQPIFELKTKKIVGLNVMIHWQHPKLGLMFPQQFISIAEKAGLIISISKWMIEKIIRDYAKIKELKMPLFEIVINTNISPFQLANYQISDSIKNLVEATDLPVRYIVLEINEALFLQYIETETVIEKLHGITIQPIISSLNIDSTFLNKLSKLPISSLKIDHSIIKDITKREYSTTVVKSIIQLANELKINVLAEGIDDEEQYNFLLAQGCLLGQGDYLSRPLAIDELIEHIKHEHI